MKTLVQWVIVSVFITLASAVNTNESEYTLEIINKANDKLLSVYSELTKIALVKDYAHHLAAIYNGSSGEVAVSDLKNQCHYHVERTPVHSWTASASSWAAHFARIHSLVPLFQEAKRQNIVECAPDEHTPVFDALAKGYVALGSFLPPNETYNMLVKFVEHLQGPLGKLYRKNSGFKIPNNLEWFLKVNLALAKLLNNGKIEKAIEKANVDVKLVFGKCNAAEGLLDFFVNVGPHYDIFQIISPHLSEDLILEFLAKISGGSHKCIDGLINIITQIISYLRGKGDIDGIISALIKYRPDTGVARLHAYVTKLLKYIEAHPPKGRLPPQFYLFVQFLKDIRDDKLIVDGIKISEIINSLGTRKPNDGVSFVLRILSKFSADKGIPQLFSFVIEALNGTSDVQLLQKLIPGVNLKKFNGSGTILQQILHGKNLTQLLKQGTSALIKLEVIGQVVKEIQSAYPGVDIDPYLRHSTVSGNQSRHTLEIINNAKDKLLTVYSEFTKIALVKDYAHNLAAIYNGSSGEVAVSDLKNQCHYHVERTPVHSWTASASSWAAHFATIHSLIPLLQEAKRQNIVECEPDEHTPVFAALAKGYISLGSLLPPKETYGLIVQLVEHLQGPLGSLYKNNTRFSISNNLEWFLKVNLAIAKLLEDGKIRKDLEKANVDLKLIFGQGTAAEGILNLFGHSHSSISSLIIGWWNDPNFNFLQLLSGGSDQCIDGLLKIVIKLLLYKRGSHNLNSVITSIINYKPNIGLTRLHAYVNVLIKLIEQFHHPKRDLFLDFLIAIREDKLIVDGVNISDTMILLSTRKPGQTIQYVLKVLSKVAPDRGIPEVFNFVVGVLNGTLDVHLLPKIVPGVNLANFNGTGTILQQILHGKNLTQLLNQGNSAILPIPILGQVVKEIELTYPGVDIFTYLTKHNKGGHPPVCSEPAQADTKKSR